MIETDWRLAWHLLVLQSEARFKVIVAHRKAKKTLLIVKEMDRWAQAIPAVYWIVEPTLAQGKKIVWDDPDMMQRNVLPYAWEHRNITDHYLQYPNGSKVYLIGAKGENALRGPNPLGIALDEYDDMGSDVWPTVQPIMTANPDAWCWFCGTYKGKKDLYAKMQYAREHPDWFGITIPASTSGIITADALAEAKATTTAAFFDMEYECVPVEGGTSFFTRIKENVWHGRFSQLVGLVFKLGVDLAKYNDWTVITPLEVTDRPSEWGEAERPFYAGMPERFNRIDWPLQKARIMAAWGLYNKATVTLDYTGVGNPVGDDLKGHISPLELFTFTEKTRRDLLVNLQLALAQDKIKIPDYEPLINELESFSYEVTKSGRVSITVPENQHDDCVMSLALALWEAKRIKPSMRPQQIAPAKGQWRDNTDDLWRGN